MGQVLIPLSTEQHSSAIGTRRKCCPSLRWLREHRWCLLRVKADIPSLSASGSISTATPTCSSQRLAPTLLRGTVGHQVLGKLCHAWVTWLRLSSCGDCADNQRSPHAHRDQTAETKDFSLHPPAHLWHSHARCLRRARPTGPDPASGPTTSLSSERRTWDWQIDIRPLPLCRRHMNGHAQPGVAGGTVLLAVPGKRQRPEQTSKWMAGTCDAVKRGGTCGCRTIDRSHDRYLCNSMVVSGSSGLLPFRPALLHLG